MLHSNSVCVQRRFIDHLIKEKKELHNIDNKQWICHMHMQCVYGELPIERWAPPIASISMVGNMQMDLKRCPGYLNKPTPFVMKVCKEYFKKKKKKKMKKKRRERKWKEMYSIHGESPLIANEWAVETLIERNQPLIANVTIKRKVV